MTTPLKRLLNGSSALTPPIVRDPVSAAIATAITGATTGFAFTAVQILAGIGVSMVVSYALQTLAPQQGLSSAGSAGLLVNVRDPAAPREYVYGRVRKGGVATYYEATNDNKFLHMILVLAAHEVEAIDDIYIDDKLVTINGSGFVTSHGWNSKIRIKKYLGTASQTVDPNLLAESNQINSNFRGRGIAYLYIRLEYDSDVFTSGIPLFTAIVRGKKVLDPRTSLTGYSNNWALCVRDYLIADYGLGDLAANVDNTYVNIAANISDEMVSGIKRYEMNAVIRADEKVGDVLKKMMTAGAGTLYWGQGRWRMRAGAWTPSARSITLSSLRSGLTVQTRQSARDNFNIVRGTFLNEQKRFIEMDYPEIRSATFITQDGNKEKPFDLELPYTTHPYRCSRIARIVLFRSREQITIAGEFGMEMFGIEVGDTVSFTYDRYGWTNKTFEVSSWHYVAADNGELKISVMLRETSAAVYGSSVEDERTIIGNDTTLPDPNIAMVITGLAQTSTTRVERDGRVTCAAFVSWNPVVNSYLRHYQVQWKLNSRTDWNSTTTTNPSIELTGLSEDQLMNVRVRALSVYDNHGPFATLNFTPTADITPPSQPTLVATDPGYDNITVRWVNPTQTDFRHVEVYWNTTNNAAGAQLLGTTDGTAFMHPNLAIGVTRWYFLKSVDFTGNKSAFTTGVSGTTTGVPTVDLIGEIVAAQVADGAINTAKFATGIVPVEIVGSLPTTGNFEGRTVYLTTDNKLYRHTGSPTGSAGFTAAVPAVDVTGQLTNAQLAGIEAAKITGQITAPQIANGAINTAKFATGIVPVEIVGSLPTTGNFEGRTVYLTTDDKLYRHTGSPTGSAGFTRATDGADIVANSITAGQIAAGAISATEIAAGAITASKIAVTDFTNFVPDGQLQDAAAWSNNNYTLFLTTNATAAVNSKGELRYTGAYNVGVQRSNGRQFNVRPGQEFWFSFQMARTSGTTYRAYASLVWYDRDNNITATHLSDITTDRTGFVTIEGSVTVPANTVSAMFRWSVDTAFTDSIVRFWAPTIRLKNGGELIVDGAITADKIAANAITAVKIDSGAVTTAKLAAGAVTADTIASNAITTVKINADAVTGAKIAANAITSDKITANAITSAKVAAGAITTTELAAGAVSATKLAVADFTNLVPDSQIQDTSAWSNAANFLVILTTSADPPPSKGEVRYVGPYNVGTSSCDGLNFDVVAGQEYWFQYVLGLINGTTYRAYAQIRYEDKSGAFLSATTLGSSTTDRTGLATIEGSITVPANAVRAKWRWGLNTDFTDANVRCWAPTIRLKNGGKLIVDGAITADKIAANAVTAVKIDSGAVTTAKLAAGAVTADTIASNAITTVKINADAVTGAKIAANTITASDIAADTITAGQIAAGAVAASEIAAGAVNTSKLAAGSVTANEIAANTITAGQLATDSVTAAKIASNSITSAKIAANAITAGKIAAAAINTTDLIVDGAVSRRVYARGSNVTLTTSYQQVVSKTFGSGSFVAFQGTVGSRSNPILLNIDMQFTIYSGGSGWHECRIAGELNIGGTWQSAFLAQDIKVPLDAAFGLFQYTKAFVIDSGSWSTATAMRLRVSKSATSVRIDCNADYMLTQISV